MAGLMTMDTLIREAEVALDYGTVSFTIKKNGEHGKTIDLTKITSKVVNGNAQALTVIGTMLKLLSESHQTGNLTFTIELKQGDSHRLLTHDFKRVNL